MKLREIWPLGLVVAGVWWAVAVAMLGTVQLTGELAYALDDAYIHMALAKNLVEHGVWGVTPYGFSSAVSSLGWPVLLAAIDLIAGVHVSTPFWLNMVLGAALLATCHLIMVKQPSRPHGLLVLGTLAAIAILAPLPVNMLIGMEHVLQMLVLIPMAYLAARLIEDPHGERSRRDRRWLFALVALAPVVRYESLFAVLAICLVMALHRRLGDAVWLGLVSLVPIGAFGLYSVAQGSFLLPNPVLVKGTATHAVGLGHLHFLVRNGIGQLMASPHLLGVMLAAAALLLGRWRTLGLKATSQVFLALFLMTAVQQLVLASVDWFFRYEAYLMAWGALAVGLAIAELLRLEGLPRRRAWVAVGLSGLSVVGLFLLSPRYQERLACLTRIPDYMIGRATTSLRIVPGTARNKRDQNVMMGRFVNTYYSGEAVVANDIGGLTYYAPIRCVDLMGLADVEAAKLIRAGRLDRAAIDRLSRDRRAKIAILYEHTFKGRIPERWVRVGRWQFEGHERIPRGTVAFFALEPADRSALEAQLTAFAPSMPSRVKLLIDR